MSQMKSIQTLDGRAWWWAEVIFPLVSFLLVLAILPFFLPLSLIFAIYRHILRNRIKVKYPDVTMTDHNDAIWFQDTRTNMAIINSLMLLKGKPDIKKFEKTINERLVMAKGDDGKLLFPKFTQYHKQIMHRHVWVQQENFDIGDHVYKWDKSLPQTKNELESLIGYLCSQPLPDGKALWQVIIVPSTNRTDDQFYALLRVHHGVADGIALTRVLMNKVVDVPPAEHRPIRFGSKNQWLRTIKAVFTGPALLFERLAMGLDRNALHGAPLSGDKLVAWSNQMDLQMVKRMKNAAGCTVNDIIMSCLAGALREYFKQHSSTIPNNIEAYVPVDIRHSSSLSLDNQFALVFFPLPLHTDDSMLQLQETKLRMDKIKNSAEPLLNAYIITYCMARLPNWLTRFLFNNMSDKCSMILSNVPGPQEKLFLAGHAMEDAIFWPPQRARVGMGVSILSYNGHVKMGLIVDRVILSNPSVLVTLFEQQVNKVAKQLNST